VCVFVCVCVCVCVCVFSANCLPYQPHPPHPSLPPLPPSSRTYLLTAHAEDQRNVGKGRNNQNSFGEPPGKPTTPPSSSLKCNSCFNFTRVRNEFKGKKKEKVYDEIRCAARLPCSLASPFSIKNKQIKTKIMIKQGNKAASLHTLVHTHKAMR